MQTRAIRFMPTRKPPISDPAVERSAEASGADQADRLLIRRFRNGSDPEARERLVRRHERLVWSIAWRYRATGEPIEDLAQEGFLGFLRAIDRYDCASAAKFSSYAALKITGNIEHYLRDRSATIRQPGWIQELLSRVQREDQRLTQLQGRRPTLSEIARSLGVEEHRVTRAVETLMTRAIVSLDEPVSGSDAEGPSLAEIVADSALEEKAEQLDERIDLERAISRLDETQKRALSLCFYEEMTFEEAGGAMGMDRHRTRRVVTRAVRILREHLQTA